MQAHVERIPVKVRANAPRTAVLREEDGVLVVAVAAPPEGNRANRELVKFFAKKLKKRVKIVSGMKSRSKILEVF